MLRTLYILFIFCTSLSTCVHADEPAKITFDEHIKPIFREHCTSCHNNNAKKGGLSLDSYQMSMTGGGSGEVFVAGDLDSSRLFALTAHKEQPVMPPMQDRISQAKLDLLKTWIEQGMPENSGSAIRKPTASAAALSVVSVGRPEGPPPMPTSVLKQTPMYTPKAAAISALAASPWSPLVAVGGQMQVALYHSTTGELLGIIPFPEGEPQSITFSRDGRLILIGGGRHSASGVAVLHDLGTGKRIASVGDELDIVLAADISDDNRFIALAGPQKLVRVYETLTGELKWEQKKHTDWIYALRFSPDGLLLATADRAAGLVIWETGTGRMYADLQGHKGEIRSLAWRPDSGAVVTASLDGTLKMWDVNESKLAKSWDAHGGGVAAIAICNDGTMASTGRDNKVKVWDGAGNAAGEMPGLVEAGHEVAITVDGTHVVAGDWAGNVRLWTRANPADEKRLAPNPPTLEMAIESGKQRFNELVVAAQASASELNAMQVKFESSQKQLAEQQSLVALIASQVQAATTSANEIKALLDAYPAQITAKQAEIANLDQAILTKSAQQNQADLEKKQAEEAVQALQRQKETAPPDPVALDAQIAEGEKRVVEKAGNVAQATTELNALTAEKALRESEMAELARASDAKAQEHAVWVSKINELNAAKVTADARLEVVTKESTTANEQFAAAKAKVDVANANVASSQAWMKNLESDLARFLGMTGEFAAQQAALEQSVGQIRSEVSVGESQLAAAQPKMDAAMQTVVQLEQQLAELQKQLAAALESKTAVTSEMTGYQQALDAAKNKMLQVQSELASLAAQQKLFDESYKASSK